jgi:drug/metabolite transporter (DMT)-like permease
LARTNPQPQAALKDETLETEKPVTSGPAPTGFSAVDLLLLGCILIWAINSPIVKIVLREIAPLAVSQFRVVIAALISLGVVWNRERSVYINRKHLPQLCLAAFMGITVNQITFIYALNNTSASAVSLIYAVSPIFATLLAALIYREKIKRTYFIGLPLALVGVALVVLTAPNVSLDGNLLGNLLAIGMAFSWAAYTVLLRPLLGYYSPLRLSALCFTIGGLFLLPFSFSQTVEAVAAPASLYAWALLFASSFFAMIVTNLLWYNGVKKLGVSRTAYYSYLQPFFGVLAAALMLGEIFVLPQIIGGLLVIGSLLLYRLVR